MNSLSKFLLIAATLTAASSAFAVTITKAGSGTELTDSASWTGGVAPGTADLANFDSTSLTGTSGAPLTVSSAVAWMQLNFASTLAGTEYITGSTITLNNSSDTGPSVTNAPLANQSGQAVTIENNLSFTASGASVRNQIYVTGAGSLTIGRTDGTSTIATTNGKLSVRGGGAGMTTINSAITATTFTKADGNSVTLNNANTIGSVAFTGGKIFVGNNGALGSGLVTVGNGSNNAALTLGASGSTAITLANNFDLNASGATNTTSLTIDSTGAGITLNGNITQSGASTGAKSVTLSGANAIKLGGNNTFSGGLTLNSTGITTISGTNAAQTWTISSNSANVGVVFSNTGAIGSGSTLNVTSSANFTPSIQIADNVGIVGAGSTINISGGRGTFAIGTGDTLAANITVSSNNTLQFVVGSNSVISGNINAGAGQLGVRNDFGTVTGVTKNNTGTFTISGNITGSGAFNGPNTFTGALALNGDNSGYSGNIATNGYSSVSFAQNLGTGTVSLGNTTTGQTLNYTGTGSTTSAVLNLSGTTGGVTINQNGSGSLKFTSNLTATGAGAKTITLQGTSVTGTGEIAGIIVDNSGTNTTAVSKAGTAAWVLSGANTYTGGTSVTGGTLVTGHASALGGGNVSATGGTLQIGNGTTNVVTLASTATLTLGSGAKLALGGINLASLDAGAATAANSVISMGSGAYDLGSGILDLGGVLNNLTAGTHTYNLIAGGSQTSGFNVSTVTGYDSTVDGASFSFTNGQLTFTAVPEPSTYGLIGAGALAAVSLVRRRRKPLVRAE